LTCEERPRTLRSAPEPTHRNSRSALEYQAEGIDRAREILGNDGGGELQVRGLDGTIRKQDTVPPGNDPTASKG
jgi:hypothetical protein